METTSFERLQNPMALMHREQSSDREALLWPLSAPIELSSWQALDTITPIAWRRNLVFELSKILCITESVMPLCISGSILEISYQIYLDPCGSHGVRRFTNWCEILLGDAQKPSADGETDSNNRKILLILLVYMSHEFVKSQGSLRTWRFVGEFSMTILRFACKPWLATVVANADSTSFSVSDLSRGIERCLLNASDFRVWSASSTHKKIASDPFEQDEDGNLKNSRVHWSSV